MIAAASALALLPPLAWTIRHGWATVRHLAQLGSAERAAPRSPLSTLGEFVASQAGILGVTLFVAVVVVLWRAVAAARAGDDRSRFVGATAARWRADAPGAARAQRLALLLGPTALVSALGLTELPRPSPARTHHASTPATVSLAGQLWGRPWAV